MQQVMEVFLPALDLLPPYLPYSQAVWDSMLALLLLALFHHQTIRSSNTNKPSLPIILILGQVLSESRLTAWQSSDGLPFEYSGKVMESAPFSPNVLRLRDALYDRTGVLYDGVLLNLYESR